MSNVNLIANKIIDYNPQKKDYIFSNYRIIINFSRIFFGKRQFFTKKTQIDLLIIKNNLDFCLDIVH